MQDVVRRSFAGLPDALVNPHLLPASSIFGSFWGRFAFMGKAVFGRLMVVFSSRALVDVSQMIESFHYREPRQERLCELDREGMSIRELEHYEMHCVTRKKVTI